MFFDNIFRVRVFTSSGSTGGCGRDAKTIISPNTLFCGITINLNIATCVNQYRQLN